MQGRIEREGDQLACDLSANLSVEALAKEEGEKSGKPGALDPKR